MSRLPKPCAEGLKPSPWAVGTGDSRGEGGSGRAAPPGSRGAVLWLLLLLILPGCGPKAGGGALDAARPDGSAAGDAGGPVDAAGHDAAASDAGGAQDAGDSGDARVTCSGPEDCDDGNPCTQGQCGLDGQCTQSPAAGLCDDGDGCTAEDACQAGACVGREACCADGQDNDGDGALDCDDSDCAADPVCQGTCPTVPAPDPVPDAPLPGEDPPGVFETVQAGGFTDEYLYNQAHFLKVGVRREWGGTIVFFGMDDGTPGMNGTNVIDANDTGREVQVAFYDPDRQMQNCAYNASCASVQSQCPLSITYLGWNPVQGGNRCNHGSGVESVDTSGGVLTVTLRPLFWNPNWDEPTCESGGCNDPALWSRPSDVRVVQRLRFVRPHVLELDYTVQNLSALDHRATAQEFPTVYTANGNAGPDLYRLFDSTGTEVIIDTPGNDGFFYENFTSPGGWVTMQRDDLTYGVGLYAESRIQNWQGWQLRSLPFNNFRPLYTFGIPANGTVRGRSYLLIGNQATVAGEAAWLDANLPPFGVLDAPTADATLSGQVTVRGWALDNKGVAQVAVRVDGGAPQPLTYGTSRPDVCRVWPTYAGCDAVGYQGTLDVSGLSACPHLLEIEATDGDGNTRVIARRRVFVQP